jgi:hypothetical protein
LDSAVALAVVALAPHCAFASDQDRCPRPAAGSVVTPPPDLFSDDGVLNVVFNYFTTVDGDGRTLFCFTTPDGNESPTLHVNPGDTLNVTVTNQVPAPPLQARRPRSSRMDPTNVAIRS